MKVNIEPHTRIRMDYYNISESQVLDVLLTGRDAEAKLGRKSKYKIFPFAETIRGRFYPQLRLDVVFVEEHGEIYTVTIYARYGVWED